MRFILCAFYVLLAVVWYALPNKTRLELLFAVPVPRDFRQRTEGRHAIRSFRTVIAVAVLCGVAAILLSPPALLNATAAVFPFLLVAAGAISFYWQRRKLLPAAVQF